MTELLIYNYLVENGYNPSTTYRNFLAIRVPADIKEALIKGEIGQMRAIELARNRKARRDFGMAQVILDEFVSAIEKMRW